jgi:hypothetical protein
MPGLPSGLLPSAFPTKPLYAPLRPMLTTCPTHPILLKFITQTTLVEQYRSFGSSSHSFLNSPVTSSLLGQNILLNTLFSNKPQPMFLPQRDQPSFTPIPKNRQNYIPYTCLVNCSAIALIVQKGTFTQDEYSVYILYNRFA